jgi:transcriptional regulator CBF1
MANQTGGSAAGNTSNKRKRGAGDQEGAPATKVQNTSANGDHDSNNFGLLLQGDGILSDDNTRTAQAALNAPGMNPSGYPDPGNTHGDTGLSFQFDDPSPTAMNIPQAPVAAPPATVSDATNQGQTKPQVGSAEWHQNRKDNHKEGMHCHTPTAVFLAKADNHSHSRASSSRSHQ